MPPSSQRQYFSVLFRVELTEEWDSGEGSASAFHGLLTELGQVVHDRQKQDPWKRDGGIEARRLAESRVWGSKLEKPEVLSNGASICRTSRFCLYLQVPNQSQSLLSPMGMSVTMPILYLAFRGRPTGRGAWMPNMEVMVTMAAGMTRL